MSKDSNQSVIGRQLDLCRTQGCHRFDLAAGCQILEKASRVGTIFNSSRRPFFIVLGRI